MASSAAKSLSEALQLLATVERTKGVRPLIALTLQIERWLSPDRPISIDGEVFERPGYPLGVRDDVGGELWLLPDGQLLERPPAAGGEPLRVYEISDDVLPRHELVERLRSALIDSYLMQAMIPSLTGQEMQVAIAEVIVIAGRVDGPSRALLLGALRSAMTPDEEWSAVAVRLRSSFEHALGDRSARVRDLAARSLVDMAAIGPRPPDQVVSPERMLEVPFTSTDKVVIAAALEEILELPDEFLAGIAEAAGVHARAALASGDPEVRRIAGALEIRLLGEDDAFDSVGSSRVDDSLAGESGTVERANALRALADDPEALLPRLPQVLEALIDQSPMVREAALAGTRALFPHADQPIQLRVITTLLESADSTVVAAGLLLLGRPPITIGDAARRGLEKALDGPQETRVDVANRLADECLQYDLDDAAACYSLMLRHPDRDVRAKVLRRLAVDAVGRATLRDLLTHDLVEHLHDPLPELRVATARALIGMEFPNAIALVTQLSADPDAGVRNGALALLETSGDASSLGMAEAAALDVRRLVDLASSGDGDARIAWSAALERIVERKDPRRIALLITVLRSIPPDSDDEFQRFATGELDSALLAAAADPLSRTDGALGVARRFLEPPAEPRHAARLAGAAAQDDPQAFDLLWTMFTRTVGLGSDTARRELANLARVQKSADVREAIEGALHSETDSARQDVLRTILGRGPGVR